MAEQEKAAGNVEYKKKNFGKALEHYRKAIELDGTNMIYRTNITAVYLEQKKYQECIDECHTAIEIGRKNRADYKLIGKAYSRMGNAARKLGDNKTAKTYYEKSLSENGTPETRVLIAEVEAIIKEEEDKLKAEMLGKLKELGNMVLRPFGISTDNFQLQQDPNTGSYSVNFTK